MRSWDEDWNRRARQLAENGLYQPSTEHDACGVGLVAAIDGKPRRSIVEAGIEALKAVYHRGAVDADGKTGDGAGIHLQLPFGFFRDHIRHTGQALSDGKVAVGMLFLPKKNLAAQETCRAIVESEILRLGYAIYGWRQVPVKAGVIGDVANESRPEIEQILIACKDGADTQRFELDLYFIRKRIEHAVRAHAINDFYICSLSCRSIIYKGLFKAEQLTAFYPDLLDARFISAYAIFHQRFSTNTAPAWHLAQPFRLLAHNGEINTLKGNINFMRSHEATFQCDAFAGFEDAVAPVIPDNTSDTGALDSVMEVLTRAGRPLPLAKLILIPPAWHMDADMPPAHQHMFSFLASVSEQWDGPAAIAATDGEWVIAGMDRGGLRPMRYTISNDGILAVCSESGMVEIADADIVERGRLGPGEIIGIQLREGALYKDEALKDYLAAQHPYREWAKNVISLRDIPPIPNAQSLMPMQLRALQLAAGHSYEDIETILHPMAAEGKEAVGSMGDDTPLAILSDRQRGFHHFFRQNFSQVTNPPIDSLRERRVMSLYTRFGNDGNYLALDSSHSNILLVDTPVLLSHELNAIRGHFSHRVTEIDCLFTISEKKGALRNGINQLVQRAEEAMHRNRSYLILTDERMDAEHAAIPMILAVSAVHAHLVKHKLRKKASLLVRTAECLDVHACAVLIGCGATVVNPYMAEATIVERFKALPLEGGGLGGGRQLQTRTLREDSVDIALQSRCNTLTDSDPHPTLPLPGGGDERPPHAQQFREYSTSQIAHARELRTTMTDAEKKLWRYLSNTQTDYRFRRQHPIGHYIVDFICTKQNLIIELDGGQHAEQQDYDNARTVFLQQQGYRVLRFWNNEVMENIEGVWQVIMAALQARPLEGGGLGGGRQLQTRTLREDSVGITLQSRGNTSIDSDPHPTLPLPGGGNQPPVSHYLTNYREALNQGLLKIMAKMGISVISAYRGGLNFEALGLSRALAAEFFPGLPSRISGIGLDGIEKRVRVRHQKALGGGDWGVDTSPIPNPQPPMPPLPIGGFYRFRANEETHAWEARQIHLLQSAVGTGAYSIYKQYAEAVHNNPPLHLRDLLDFRAGAQPIALEQVESVTEIRKRFIAPAMSLGALSPEAHQTLAIAMNRIGAASNSGEGGEGAERYQPLANGDNANSTIKQIASGRFGVTMDYINSASELQIKVAQGAKPGEGGQLPAFKVTLEIARLRHATEGVSLISPPPHHDIYSIEDLAQLIYDLKQANPRAIVSVKLVAQSGIGTIASGVAKAMADKIVIAGHNGGTGAAAWSSIKHAGIPWEMGLSEANQVLTLNRLRHRVKLQTDGGLKTGRDIVIAAMLGAEEYALGTASLVAMGCLMVRQCHSNTCPVGITTQNPVLREKFSGTVDKVVNLFSFVAEEVREILASLGASSLNDIIGRADLLMQVNHGGEDLVDLDLNTLLAQADSGGNSRYYSLEGRNEVADSLDMQMLEDVQKALESGEKIQLNYTVKNTMRAIGTRLSSVMIRHPERSEGSQYVARDSSPVAQNDAFQPDHITLQLRGSAGQSLGAFAVQGLKIMLYGDANDYVGKGLSGGMIVIRPKPSSTLIAHENTIIGNTVLYGATAGKLFAAGQAGERFAVRNSGAEAVVEGCGSNGCEYMTGGMAIILGTCGHNFAAGMTGGMAFVYDEQERFSAHVNADTVVWQRLASAYWEEKLYKLLNQHIIETGSQRAQEILSNWENRRSNFWQICPKEMINRLESPLTDTLPAREAHA